MSPSALLPEPPTLVDRLEAALPQTQCTRCGYPDCRAYAQAMASGQANINRCPPGGQEGVVRLAGLTGQQPVALDPSRGAEGPRLLAFIDENWCIGCTLCIKVCPVDCIVGAPKLMHTVVENLCTGCELCVPVCPVDCIALTPVTPGRSGWQAWSPAQAETAGERYAFHRLRFERDLQENDQRLAAKAAEKLADLENHTLLNDPQAIAAKWAVIEAALARSRQARLDRA